MITCFYHDADLDGHSSGAIVKLVHPDAKLVGFNYGDKFDTAEFSDGDVVIMADVSLPEDRLTETLENFSANGVTFIWIDHHWSAIEALGRLPERLRNTVKGSWQTGKAACELVYEYFLGRPAPEAIELLGVYDSWRFVPGSKEECRVKDFQYGVRSLVDDTHPDKAVSMWKELLGPSAVSTIDKALAQGALIRSYVDRESRKVVKARGFDIELPGPDGTSLRCAAVNHRGGSEMFVEFFDPDRHDAMLVFQVSRDREYYVSLYAGKPDVNCAVFARMYGGGGHKGAAGFTCKELPF